jgi:hypothetical protein
LKVQSSCQNVVYLPEDPPATRPEDWKPPEDNVWQSCDAVATPRGIVKIRDGCDCRLECDGGLDYKVTCKCSAINYLIAPDTLPPGSEFPDPRDAGWFWVATRNLYVRSSSGTTYIFD